MPLEKSDEDMCLPRATIDRLIQELLPKGLSVSKATREMLRDSSQLFLEIVAVEANRICEIENKRTITNQHIYKSLEKYGFGEYVDSCISASADYEEYSRHKPSRQDKFKESGKTLDELHEDQMRLFNEAKKNVDATFGVGGNNTDSETE